MAHYAILDENNIVLEVITGIDETEDAPEGHDDWESFYSSVKGDKTVKRTSYNTLLGCLLYTSPSPRPKGESRNP